MSLNLYFLRHGETTHSQDDAFCGTTDPALTERGEKMAEAFANAYQGMNWAAIYVSPLLRTRQTAQPICKATGLEPQLREGIQEMNFGLWEGQNRDRVQRDYLQEYVCWLTEPAWNAPPEGETAVQVASRASLVIAEIEDRHESGNVLLISHKSTIRILLCSLLGLDLGRYRDRIEMPVSSVSVIKFDLYGPMLQRLGDRAHLPEDLRV
ncbi:histidine phosphatase family protein [Lyngbya confervoides]|uniref:Histidine phosphatase family protein n=1 Tax=Lyngbya confervoides BDU141951 TaxID=1574623 RepID=A0ABD4T8L5_9CYAN|nr:histidine phosphatase family protein [Lyngbya confervoides]MCM1984869.1 histidine phosphatase family protein [Lyngbya confervoides BDU141951]